MAVTKMVKLTVYIDGGKGGGRQKHRIHAQGVSTVGCQGKNYRILKQGKHVVCERVG